MKKKIMVLVGVVTILGMIGWFGFRYDLWEAKEPNVLMYSGTIESTFVPVQAEQGGKIVEMLVQEGQEVKSGDVIARLDDRAARITLETAQAQLRQAEAKLNDLLNGSSEQTILAQKAAVDVTRQSVNAAQLTIEKLTIKSPINGIVFYRHTEPGQVVNAGTRIVTLINPDDLWVKVYVPEAELDQVKVGGSALITVDAYPDQEFRGEVQFISDQAEFTPKNVQTREEQTKTVYAVKIRISEGKDVLKAGMPADIRFQ